MTYWIWKNLGTIALIESMTEDGVIIVDVRDLTDVETDVAKIRKKIQAIAGLLSLGHRVAIRCVGGLNRSNAIAVSVMCFMHPQGDVDQSWNFHRDWAKAKVNRLHIVPDIERTCKKVLEELAKDFRGQDETDG